MSKKPQILLVGCGPMALAYAQVLTDLKIPMLVIGRGNASANAFEQTTGTKVIRGGLANWLKTKPQLPARAIVAVTEDQLGKTTQALIRAGVKKILVEKPGGFTFNDIRTTHRLAQQKKARVWIGYNRRFYASTRAAQRQIVKDGGVISFNFEFTEWINRIPQAKKDSGMAKQWFLANSTHVIDLAFFLGGAPSRLTGFTAGGFPWHPSASRYAGAGTTKPGVLFSYQANWESAGRWNLEILTKRSRLIFRPMEKLQIQKTGSLDVVEVPIDDEVDTHYKPGIMRQVQAFLKTPSHLLSLGEQVKLLPLYETIATGGNTRR